MDQSVWSTSTASTHVLGIDVGGSGIKGAIVDTQNGSRVGDRYRLATPARATPKAMARVVARIVKHFDWQGPVGCGMPGPIKNGRVLALANLDKSWIGVRAHQCYSEACGCAVSVLNDADAAGLAEMRFGSGKDLAGVVVVITLGTGIGSALFVNGVMVPNTEFGQMELHGRRAEEWAAARIRKERNLSWKRWSKHLDEYLHAVEDVLYPDAMIIGGGVSRKADKFFPMLTVKTPLYPAALRNDAGIVGAALGADMLAVNVRPVERVARRREPSPIVHEGVHVGLT
jgi:polyphosphate glucokinase